MAIRGLLLLVIFFGASPLGARTLRGGIEMSLDRVHSARSGALTMRGQGFSLSLRAEYEFLPHYYAFSSIAAGLDAGLSIGPKHVSVPDAFLANFSAAVGGSFEFFPRWKIRKAVTINRLFYLSPRVIGDSSLAPGLLVELVYVVFAWPLLEIGVNSRAQVMFDRDPHRIRQTWWFLFGTEILIGG